MAEKSGRRKETPGDGLEGDFGPGDEATPGSGEPPSANGRTAAREDPFPGFGAGIPCGRDGCLLKPVGDLLGRFAFELARRGHSDSATRAASSGIGLLRALRDFLDEEIAFAERAAEARRTAARYTKIPVE